MSHVTCMCVLASNEVDRQNGHLSKTDFNLDKSEATEPPQR